MLSPRRLVEMKHGRNALVHTIGADDSFGLSQLPNPNVCPANATPEKDELDASRFGLALAESYLKLLRPEADFQTPIEAHGWLGNYIEKIPNKWARYAFLCRIEELLLIALLFPEHLPAVAERLDALDNEALQEQATKALCWETVRPVTANDFGLFGDDGGLFAGLEGVEL